MKADVKAKVAKPATPTISRPNLNAIKIQKKVPTSPIKIYRCNICRLTQKTRQLIEKHCEGQFFNTYQSVCDFIM